MYAAAAALKSSLVTLLVTSRLLPIRLALRQILTPSSFLKSSTRTIPYLLTYANAD